MQVKLKLETKLKMKLRCFKLNKEKNETKISTIQKNYFQQKFYKTVHFFFATYKRPINNCSNSHTDCHLI